MATLLQVTCFILLVNMVHGWGFPSVFDQNTPSTNFRDSDNNNSTAAFVFEDINKMMAAMQQRFQRLFDLSPFLTAHNDEPTEDRKKLDAVEPVCTTKTNSPSSTTSIRQTRRKKFRTTQTTTCVKELIIDGKKQMYKEMNVTDEKGLLIAQSKSYQIMSIDTYNNTTPIPMSSGDKNVISY